MEQIGEGARNTWGAVQVLRVPRTEKGVCWGGGGHGTSLAFLLWQKGKEGCRGHGHLSYVPLQRPRLLLAI